ncbi:MAG: hypothetical protein E6Q97_08375 [Desulfurellales bacterium]|nr:MAG: hypothetical protein E6Q97_08375 [Desulfurellales bacterium]
MYVHLDEQLGILVDEQGIMVPASDLKVLQEEITKHLARSPLELKALGRMTVERHGPKTALQFNWDYFE